MSLDPAGIAHAACGDDQRAVLNFRQRPRFLVVINEADARPIAVFLDPAHCLDCIVIGDVEMLEGDLRGANRHRRVDVDFQLGNPPLPKQLDDQVDEILGTSYGECGNDDIAFACLHSCCDGVGKLLQAAGE